MRVSIRRRLIAVLLLSPLPYLLLLMVAIDSPAQRSMVSLTTT